MSLSLWRVLDKGWNFKLHSIRLGFFSLIRRSYSLSFGCWLHIASQDIQTHSSPLVTVTRSLVSLDPSPFHYSKRWDLEQDESKLQYLPLETSEIRLFVLCPGSDADVVSGHIEHSSWGYQSGKQYEALSYVWGDIRDCDTILVGGRTVSVTKSLETALRHLRSVWEMSRVE